MSTTLHAVAGRPQLRIERRLAHPPEKVWRALTEPAELSQWYPFQATAIDLRVGGMIRFDDGEGTTMDAVIVELDPPRVFAFSERAPEAMSRESEDLVRFELRPDGAGCLLIFTHTFDDRFAAASYASGWQLCLDALEEIVAGRQPTASGPMDQLLEHYVAVLGLAEGTAETTPEGWRVRFERQLVRPAELVWVALGLTPGQGAPAVGAAPPEGATVAQFPAGAVTAAAPPELLEYEWRLDGRPAGRVRWELSSGTGHGARLVLTQTGPRELADAQAIALTAWKGHIEQLAARLLELPSARG